MNHALLFDETINLKSVVHVYSHQQALLEHRSFLEQYFSHFIAHEETNTPVAALKMQKGLYLKNSAVIAPIECATFYQLKILVGNLPSNTGYTTTVVFVKKSFL